MLRALVAAALILFAGPAFASDATDVVAAANAYNDAMNKNDMAGAAKSYALSATIIDEFAPHVWTGANAFQQWGADYGTFAKAQKMSDPWVTLAKPRHVNVEGDRAYVVFPATFKFKKAGKPVAEPALMTVALVKLDGQWKIAAWSWATK